MTISDASRQLAKTAAEIIGGPGTRPSVVRVHDEDERARVDIMTITDAPAEGLNTLSTLGLHSTVNLLDGKDVRVELLLVTRTGQAGMDELLGHAAFNVIKQAWLAAPGVVYPDLLREYGLSEDLPHLLLVAPFPYADLGRIDSDGLPTVHWLMGLPISDSEQHYLVQNGLDALEELLEAADAACWELGREPVV